MSDYDVLVNDLVARFPYLVLEMTGPWRDQDGKMLAEPWICNFKNSSFGYRTVHSGSSGHTMWSALEAGLDHLKQHIDSAEVRNYDTVTEYDTFYERDR